MLKQKLRKLMCKKLCLVPHEEHEFLLAECVDDVEFYKNRSEIYEGKNEALRHQLDDLIYHGPLVPNTERAAFNEAQRKLAQKLPLPELTTSSHVGVNDNGDMMHTIIWRPSRRILYQRIFSSNTPAELFKSEGFAESYKQAFYREVVPKLWAETVATIKASTH